MSPFAVRVAADVRRFDGVELRERVLLELPAGRAPPQGAVLDLRARPVAPRGPETGFDERGWLERRGIHVVLHASGPWHVVGRRGGIGGVGDRLRTEIGTRPVARDHRRAPVARRRHRPGADEGIDPDLRDAFKASGLYHLFAVSGQNIVFIGFGALGLAYVLGLGRAVGHTLAIVAILAYALAVGWQPSVVRAAVAGCLASLAWLLSRPSDRWHTMAMGAVVLLAWTPRSLLEPGFQLSFAAVGAIFLTMPRLRRLHEGYPVPAGVVEVVGISAACGIVTSPILWLQFGTIPLWTVPANALAEPAMPILLGCGLAAAILAPVIPSAALALLVIAGAAAAGIAFSARLIASLPYAQTSSRTLVLALAATVWAFVALRFVPPYRRPAAARHRRRARAPPLARLVGAAPGADVVATLGTPRLVPRCRAGRRDLARDPGGRDARGRRPARGPRRPSAPTHGSALPRRDRHPPRASRPRRGRRRRVAVARRSAP